MESKSTDRKSAGGDAKASSTSKDIWLLLSSMDPVKPAAVDSAVDLTAPPPSNDERDTFTLVVGSKGAGKTSLCSAYIHRGEDKGGASEEPKPTTGLEYVYGRQGGAVAHIWELASLRCVPDMMRVPLAPERILQGAVVVVVDLSVPGDALPYLIKWLTTIHKLVGDTLRSKEKNPVDKTAVDKLRKRAMERYGKSHVDADDVTPIAIPVLILGNKFDVFAKEDTALRKPLVQALRFFAHLYGATLLLTTTKEKPSINDMRSVFKSYVFGTSANLKTAKRVVEPVSKPVFVPVGSDSFAEIGLPEGVHKEDLLGGISDVDIKAKHWKKYVGKAYPASGAVTDTWDGGNDTEKDKPVNEFPEPNVDRARQRKADELQRYREARQKLEKAAKSMVRA